MSEQVVEEVVSTRETADLEWVPTFMAHKPEVSHCAVDLLSIDP